jgi:hypothetical protein
VKKMHGVYREMHRDLWGKGGGCAGPTDGDDGATAKRAAAEVQKHLDRHVRVPVDVDQKRLTAAVEFAGITDRLNHGMRKDLHGTDVTEAERRDLEQMWSVAAGAPSKGAAGGARHMPSSTIQGAKASLAANEKPPTFNPTGGPQGPAPARYRVPRLSKRSTSRATSRQPPPGKPATTAATGKSERQRARRAAR